jgi:hypothetical protein
LSRKNDLLWKIPSAFWVPKGEGGSGQTCKQQVGTDQTHEYQMKTLEIFEPLGTRIEPEKVGE